MALIEKQGCLLKAFETGEVTAIGHCANTWGIMGAGIALQIKKQYPKAHVMAQQYAQFKDNLENVEFLHLPFHAHCISLFRDNQPKFLFNLYGQEAIGVGNPQYQETRRNVSYAVLAKALKEMHYYLLEWPQVKIGFPKYMGCYRAGGDWHIVSELIRDTFLTKDVYIYELGAETP